MPPILPPVGARQWFIFSLKHDLPIGPDGWAVEVHPLECGDDPANLACVAGSVPCRGVRVEFVALPCDRVDLAEAIRDMNLVLHHRAGTDPPDGLPALEPALFPHFRWVVTASTVVNAGDGAPELFERAFALVADAALALRNATGAGVPDLTIETMHPVYLTAIEQPHGTLEPTGLVIVDHVHPGPPAPATDDQLAAACEFLVAHRQGSPVTAYRDLALQARMAIRHVGDYTKALLTAATACEALMKNTAWLLSFEAAQLNPDPAPTAATSRLGAMKPSQLIGNVLQPRLGGSWDSSDPTHPVGAWREHVARVRSDVLHRGHRPSAIEADEAVIAMDRLASHVSDRLAASAKVYPRTAYVLVSPEGLANRGVLAAVEAVLSDDVEGPAAWLARYVAALDDLLEDTSE